MVYQDNHCKNATPALGSSFLFASGIKTGVVRVLWQFFKINQIQPYRWEGLAKTFLWLNIGLSWEKNSLSPFYFHSQKHVTHTKARVFLTTH